MNGGPWSEADIEVLRQLYADTETAEIAARLNRTMSSVYGKANLLGLYKSEQFLKTHCRIQPGQRVGRTGEFQKGHVPANKGQRRPGWHAGNMRATQFKKGRRPHTWKPLGSERLCDGYLQRKVTDTGYPPRDWQPVHVLLWIKHYGPVPPGHAIGFINGDRRDIRIDNLVLLQRVDLMRRNSYHNNYPKEIGLLIQLRGQVIRQINRRHRHEKQDSRSA